MVVVVVAVKGFPKFIGFTRKALSIEMLWTSIEEAIFAIYSKLTSV